MSATRLGQLIGELRWPAEFIEFGVFETPTYSSTKAKTGSWSYRFSINERNPIGISFATQTYIRASMWINHNGLAIGDADPRIFTWYETGGAEVESRVIWNGTEEEIELYVNDVLVDFIPVATIGFNAQNVWFPIGIVIKADSSNGVVSVYFNGEQILTYAGDTGADIVGLFGMGNTGLNNQWATSAYMDDFYVDALSAEEPDVCPLAKRFLLSVANGAGEDAAFTPLSGANYENVDDIPPDDETTYNRVLVANQKDTFTTGNIAVPSDHAIRAVLPFAIARKTDAIASTLKLHSFDGSTYQSSAAKSLTVTYGVHFDRQVTQPDTSLWDETDFNASEFGYESSGDF